MRNNINLDLHRLLAQLRNSKQRPNRLMLGHPLGRIPQHSLQRITIKVDMIARDAEDLIPARPARVLEVQLHIGERLVDLGGDVRWNVACLGIPAALSGAFNSIADPHSLAVSVLFEVPLADTGVVEVLQVRHVCLENDVVYF